MTPVDDLATLLRSTPTDPDRFRGRNGHYDWGRLYGGQVVGQGLWAAGVTVDEGLRPHSVHAYFLRGGLTDVPVDLEVDRVRDGRSFATRRVVVRQEGRAILNLACSFQVEEESEEVQPHTLPAEAGSPGSGTDESWTSMFEHRDVGLPGRPGRSLAWMRSPDLDVDDPLVHACAIAFMADDNPMLSLAAAHSLWPPPPDRFDEVWMGASLDHAVWFHEPTRADRWHLFDATCQRLGGARGLSFGRVFDQDGRHVASVAQEGLLRVRDDR